MTTLERRPTLITGEVKARKGKNPKILVLGGNGFIGRHIVKTLEQTNTHVVIGTRSVEETRSTTRKYCEVRLHKMTAAIDWYKALDGVDVLINAVGILRERRDESFQAVHHQAVKAMAKASKDLVVPAQRNSLIKTCR